MWCGEVPHPRDSLGRVRMLCGCRLTHTAYPTPKKCISEWNRKMIRNSKLHGYTIELPLEGLPKYINYHVAYDRFIVKQRLAGKDYSLEAYNE